MRVLLRSPVYKPECAECGHTALNHTAAIAYGWVFYRCDNFLGKVWHCQECRHP
jgi:hypothetical protein